MAFLEVRLPECISYGSVFRITYNTLVVGGATGYESRNEMRSIPILQGDLSYGVKDQADLDLLINFFHTVRGRSKGFRVKDFSDYRTCGADAASSITISDQVIIASAAGGETTAQLSKTYATGLASTVRTIRKPVASTVRISRKAPATSVYEELTITTDWTLNDTTGVVTLISALQSGAALAWGGEFDAPMRFDDDNLAVRLSDFQIGDTGIPVVEVLED